MEKNKAKVVYVPELLAEFEKEQKINSGSIPRSIHAIGYHNGLTMAKAIALRMATDDAAVVVRCQKCRYWKRHTQVDREFGGCLLCSMTKHENGYCDLGKVIGSDDTEDENDT